jgi:hypothetical protein
MTLAQVCRKANNVSLLNIVEFGRRPANSARQLLIV